MNVCQICGSEGYAKLLIHCLECRSVGAHRYCVLGPPNFDDFEVKWSCEFCESDTTEPTSPISERECLDSAVDQEIAQEPEKDNLCPSPSEHAVISLNESAEGAAGSSEKPNSTLEETVKEATDLSICDQKNKHERAEIEQVKLNENGNPAATHVLDDEDPEVAPATESCEPGMSEPTTPTSSNENKSLQSEKPNISLQKTDATEVVLTSELCEPDKTDLTTPTSKTDGLSSSVEQLALQKTAQKKRENKLSSPHSKKVNIRLREPIKGPIDQSVLDTENKDGVAPSRDIKKLDDSEKDINECIQELLQSGENPRPANVKKGEKIKRSGSNNGGKIGSCEDAHLTEQTVQEDSKLVKQERKSHPKAGNGATGLRHVEELHSKKNQAGVKETSTDFVHNVSEHQSPRKKRTVFRSHSVKSNVAPKETPKEATDANKGKKSMDSKSDNGGKKKVNSSDTTCHEQVKTGKKVGPPLSKPENHDNKSRSTAVDGVQRDSKLTKEKKAISCSLSKKEDHIGKSKSYPDEKDNGAASLKRLEKSKSRPRDAELAYKADYKKPPQEETTSENEVECQRPRKKRMVVIEVDDSDEDPVVVVRNGGSYKTRSSEAVSKLNVDDVTQESSVVFDNEIPDQLPPLDMVISIPTRPLIDVAWRGYCNIIDEGVPMDLILEAHVSNKAHEKVHGAVIVLPQLLNFDIFPKNDERVWPKSFDESPLSGDVIGLYLLPVDEGSDILYERLIEKMSSHGLALKSAINNLELLVFSSLELPQHEWRFQRKYYLWGVFRPRKDLIMPINNHPSDIHVSDAQLRREAIYLSDDPTSLINEESLGRHSVEFTPEILEPVYRDYDEDQEHSYREKHYRDWDVSYRRDYDRNHSKFWKSQNGQQRCIGESSGYAYQDRFHKGCRINRWERFSKKWKYQKNKSGRSHTWNRNGSKR